MHEEAIEALYIGIGHEARLTVTRLFIILTGDHAAGHFLEEVAYWSRWAQKHGTTPDHKAGWFYRTHAEWLEKCYLSAEQVMRCVKTCALLGVEYDKRGLPAKGHYRLAPELLIYACAAHAEGMAAVDIRSGMHLTLSSDGQTLLPVMGKAFDQWKASSEDQSWAKPPTSNTSNSTSNGTSNSKEKEGSATPPARSTPAPTHGKGSNSKAKEGQGEKPKGLDTVPGGAALLEIWNAHRGPLPMADGAGTTRVKALKKFVDDHGEAAPRLLEEGAREVAVDPFWKQKRYGLDNLLRMVEGKAEAWRARTQETSAGVFANSGRKYD